MRPPPGGREQGEAMFGREHELVAALAAQHRRLWPAAQMRRVKAERGYGRGVTDLVVLDFAAAALNARLEASLAPVEVSLAYLVGALRAAGAVTRDDVARLDREVSERTNRRGVSALQESGHVVEVDGLLSLHAAMVPTLDRLVAIEAKLRDWRGGLLQASRYHAFADQVYLAMPERAAHRLASEDRDVAEALGVGVIAVGGASRILLGSPRRRPREAGVRAWAEESEIADFVGTPRRLVAPFPARFLTPTPDELVAAAL